MPFIKLNNITKCYKTKHGMRKVLDNISLTFSFGVNIGILGRNGQGKTTLLSIIGGYEYPDTGTVTRKASISWPIGFGGALHGQLTGIENIRFLSRIYNIEFDKVFDFVSSFIDIGDYINMPIKTYSSGMKSKLAFAMSMALEFDFYLVDEATSAGDSFFRQKCRDAFIERKSKSSLIMVSHNMHTIEDHCDTACVLNQGKIYFFNSIEEAKYYYMNETDSP